VPTGSTTFHEDESRLTPLTRDLHRAIVSLMEELEAIDWYQQRADATGDAELRDILRHNRDEEIEHAALTLEWIRRRSPEFDATLRGRLFTEGPILAVEEALEHGDRAGGTRGGGARANGAEADEGRSPTVGSPRKAPWTT
jgi:ferritin-like protein